MSTVLQAALSAAVFAGCFVWCWRSSPGATARAITLAGLAIRAIPGLALYWISAHRLPIGTDLQLEPGFWFFGLDAEHYYHVAATASQDGLWAIATINPLEPSVFYVKSLALALSLCGRSPVTSVLLNLAAFTALVASFIGWQKRRAGSPAGLLLALTAVSFAPSWVLWTYQPLKDTYFLCLVALFFYLADRWYERLADEGWSSAALALLAGLAALVYGLAGIRWYFAGLLIAWMPIALLPTLRRPAWWSDRRAVGVVTALVLLVQVAVSGAGPFVPLWARRIVRPVSSETLMALWRAPTYLARTVDKARSQSARVGGDTQIQHVRADEGATLTTAGPAADTAAEQVRGNLAVLFLPRSVAERVGKVSIGGGRGLWAFADLDTVWFSLITLTVAGFVVRQLLGDFRLRPVFWHVLAMTVTVALLLAYQTANFGTLFRLRSMVAVGIALVPLTLERRARRQEQRAA